MKCRHCAFEVSLTLVDLGSVPPSNAYLTEALLGSPERWYPLRVLVCENCWLVQTEDFAEVTELFTPQYAYFSGYSEIWLAHCEQYVNATVDRFGLDESSYVVEIAANDGSLLRYVAALGIPCSGVEPTAATAAVARSLGIPIVEDFFGLGLAERMLTEGPAADLVAANNVLPHVPDINDFVAGVAKLLKHDGVATFEFQHVVNLINNVHFDTIYHEHFSYLSFTSAIRILAGNGLQVFDVERLPTHGGSLRVYAQRSETGEHQENTRVSELLDEENAAGLQTRKYYAGFQAKSEKVKDDFLAFLITARRTGKTVVGYGAAAKGNTLINFAGVRSDLLPFVVDGNPAKQGMFLPGSRIPIVTEDRIRELRPDYVVILPWNVQHEIEAQLAYISDWGGQFWVIAQREDEAISTVRTPIEPRTEPRSAERGERALSTSNSIPVFNPLIGQPEFDAATEALELGWLGMGAYVGEFEEELKNLVGGDRHVVATSTGHAALHLALLSMGVGPGDEVITPSFNNIADFQAILAVGAKPVFCDILDETLCIDVEKAEALVGPNTKAIIAMDYDCFLADHGAVRQLSQRHGLRVLHDAAHSLGSNYDGTPVGSFSDVTMFSFDAVKTVTCIDGGALVVRSEEEVARLHEMRLIGMGQPASVMYGNQRAWTYDVKRLGFRYHMANLHAAIGLAQLARLPQITKTRQAACRLYNELLAGVPEVRTPASNFDDVTPFLYYIRVPETDRTQLRAHLHGNGIETGIHWQPGHQFTLLEHCRAGNLDVTNRASREILSLPLHSAMKPELVERIATSIAVFFGSR